MELLTQNIKSGNVRHIKNEQANIDVFYETMQMLQKKGLKIVLLYFPYVDLLEFNDLRREETITIFKRYALENPAIIFYDLTSSLTSKHNLYFDPNHLNPDGQKIATEKLIEVIKQIAK
jgi:lysophospholipase L1-like esterase